ncbi:MAG: RodZ domain-containing protein [Gammaproteobacteria bacterium]
MAGRDDIPSDPEQVEAFQPLPGDLLTGARRGRGWSRERVAQELNLDPPTIAALEENDFDRLGAPVFARGHLKKYALLMGLDQAAVLSAYDAVAEEPIAPSTASSAPAPSLADPSPRRRAGGFRVVLGLIVTAAIGVLVWRVTSNGNPPLAGNQAVLPDTVPEGSVTLTLNEASPLSLPGSEPETEREADAVPTSNTALTGQAESQLASSGDAGAAALEAAGPAMPGVAPEAASAAVSDTVSDTAGETTPQPARAQIDPETVTVDLIFNDDSWVEVRDPAGQRLIYRLGRAGERRSLQGNPPLRVFFGNAKGVSVMVEGKPYLIPSDKRLGNTARFVIEADATPAGGSQDD